MGKHKYREIQNVHACFFIYVNRKITKDMFSGHQSSSFFFPSHSSIMLRFSYYVKVTLLTWKIKETKRKKLVIFSFYFKETTKNLIFFCSKNPKRKYICVLSISTCSNIKNKEEELIINMMGKMINFAF